mgnify:CR=1 FL=1
MLNLRGAQQSYFFHFFSFFILASTTFLFFNLCVLLVYYYFFNTWLIDWTFAIVSSWAIWKMLTRKKLLWAIFRLKQPMTQHLSGTPAGSKMVQNHWKFQKVSFRRTLSVPWIRFFLSTAAQDGEDRNWLKKLAHVFKFRRDIFKKSPKFKHENFS